VNYKFRCIQCFEDNTIADLSKDGWDVAIKSGNIVHKRCASCGEATEVDPYSIRAKESKYLSILFYLTFGVWISVAYFCSTLSFIDIGFSLVIPSGIYFYLVKREQAKVREFNHRF